MTTRYSATAVALVFLSTIAGQVSATTISFGLAPFTGSAAEATVLVNDDTAGLFSVSVQVTPAAGTNNIGDITGIFFDASDALSLGDINIITGGPSIGFANNTSNLGGGVNLNGGGPSNPGTFDVGLRFDGFNIDDVQLVEFSVADLGGTLALADFTRFALRLQTVGPADGNRGGSSKLVSGGPTVVVPVSAAVPEPAIMLLIAVGLTGIAVVRRRRTIAQ